MKAMLLANEGYVSMLDLATALLLPVATASANYLSCSLALLVVQQQLARVLAVTTQLTCLTRLHLMVRKQ